MQGLDVLLAKCFYVGTMGFAYGASLSGFTLLDDAVRGGGGGGGGGGGAPSLSRALAGLGAAAREGAYTSRVLVAGMGVAGAACLLQHGLSAPARLHRLPFPAADDRASTWAGAAAALYVALTPEAVPARALRAACAATGATALTLALLRFAPPEA